MWTLELCGSLDDVRNKEGEGRRTMKLFFASYSGVIISEYLLVFLLIVMYPSPAIGKLPA